MLTTILALVVSAAIDSTTLFIGDQTDLHLRATCEVGEQVQLPALDKELIPGIEIVDSPHELGRYDWAGQRGRSSFSCMRGGVDRE